MDNTTAFSFLDLLRRRRELPLQEVVRLCADLPKQLDELTRLKQGGSLGLSTIGISFTAEVPDLTKLLEKPVTTWPAFLTSLTSSEEEGFDQTLANPRAEQGGTGPRAFARLLYELLGGKHRVGGAARRPPPLPALNEEGNSVLRQAIAGEAERDKCVTFWQRWLRACEVKVAGHGWRIPRWLLPVSQPGTVLHLVPQDDSGVPIQLVARPIFRIGRSRSMTDYPTRMLKASGQLDEESTVLLSRVQTLGELGPNGPVFRDGNGKKASANGTMWNGEMLSWTTPVPITAAGELVLGGACKLAVTPTPPLGETLPEIENLSEWWIPSAEPTGAPLPFSAVVFRPLNGQEVTRDAIWMGRGIGFRIPQEGGIAWDLSDPRSPLQFIVAHGCFWLANSTQEKPPIRVNEAALGPGQIAPLANEQSLDIGGRRYAVTVE